MESRSEPASRRGCFPFKGDGVQLQQVVLNLVLKAVEAMNWVEAGARELSISTEQSHAGGALVGAFSTLSTPRSPAD